MEERGELEEKIDKILEGYKGEREELLSILEEMQRIFGYLPEKGMREVAKFLGIREVEVYGVATFYTGFRFHPLGRHHIRVCLGTACHMMGGRLIMEAFERELGIKAGEVTEDLSFSIERVACVGCCSLAPVVVVGDKVYARMAPSKVEALLIELGYRKDEVRGTSGESEGEETS